MACLQKHFLIFQSMGLGHGKQDITLFCNVGESPALRPDHGPHEVEVGKEVDVIPYLGIDVTIGVVSSEAALDHRSFWEEILSRVNDSCL